MSIRTLREYIDWTPFFHAWEMRARFPGILMHETYGTEASRLYSDAQQMLDLMERENWIQAHGVLAIWPAQSNNEDQIVLYTNDERNEELARVNCLRQQLQRADGVPNLALCDFVAPVDSGFRDYTGGFAVTAGVGLDEKVAEFERDHDQYKIILLKALADRLAEAFAEYLHLLLRREIWGYASDEQLDNDAIIREEYRGIRPAPGYPACPDHTEKPLLFSLLNAGEETGITLTENLAMVPTASVCGMYFAHPESRYFGVGKLCKDQVADLANRKSIPFAEMEKWLSSSLQY